MISGCCCCGGQRTCENARAIDRLESNARLAYEIGQSLLERDQEGVKQVVTN